jgi:hypothetical protein
MSGVLPWIALGAAAVPCALFIRNSFLYQPAPAATAKTDVLLSVLIPARNEERNIAAALEAVLANRDANFEVLVLDDGSTDRTREIVAGFAAKDARVRLCDSPPLPEGWCGKVHACHQLSRYAGGALLVFVDADVRLSPDALSRFATLMESTGVDFFSGAPRQITGTWMEKLLIPLIHFALLGFLPFRRMRATTDPACAAGIGQLVIARRSSYEKAGGHAAIWNRIHDGLGLSRRFRECGLRTDLFDATDTATCRMYDRAADVWSGLAKNATEGMATPRLILPVSVLLFAGQILPWLLLIRNPSWPVVLACVLSILPRLLGAVRFHQSLLSALVHPLGMFLFLVIQWQAFIARLLGRPAQWRGRAFSFGKSAQG